ARTGTVVSGGGTPGSGRGGGGDSGVVLTVGVGSGVVPGAMVPGRAVPRYRRVRRGPSASATERWVLVRCVPASAGGTHPGRRAPRAELTRSRIAAAR